MILFDTGTAHSLLDSIAILLLATAVGSVLLRRLESSVWLLALQGLLLAAAAAAVALNTGTLHAYLAVAITVVVKALVVPGVLLLALRDVRNKREIEVVLPQRQVFLVAVALVLVAYYAVEPLRGPDGFLTRNALPTALAMLLIGLFTMLIRKKALSQIVGIVAMENGLYLMAVVATQVLPLAVELGVAVDLAVGVLVMGFFVRRIHHAFGTINTDHLRTLRG
ncbi:MAG: NADH-quinone oxidoreductase subunit K [Chloroflexota bacterium]